LRYKPVVRGDYLLFRLVSPFLQLGLNKEATVLGICRSQP